MAKIAVALERALEQRRMSGERGATAARTLAAGDGWRVADVLCTSGPQDRPFEEQHTQFSIAIVLAGTFQYRSARGHALMTPGSIMLGNPGQCFECGHEHAEGDRCVSFWYSPDFFQQLIADAGYAGRRDFRVPRIPPLRSSAPLAATAGANVVRGGGGSWEELGIELAAGAMKLATGLSGGYRAPANAEARVTRIVRSIDRRPETSRTLHTMARDAGLSPYHFLRTFERLTGVTPHQYIVRARLRDAAVRLSAEGVRILDIALDCGFGDVSNFNRMFRAEFGLSPRAYRARSR
ncbi:MAG TPA: AraC family transcriptional regulator [Vicinamibacterales bacterium]|nr:AraC family transcriptional regulator [Vicinamibacterales bacterium]